MDTVTKVTEHNAITGETIERPMTHEETTQHQADQAERAQLRGYPPYAARGHVPDQDLLVGL